MTAIEIITLVIAIYGAALASWSAWRGAHVDRPNVKVTFSSIVPVYGNTIGGTFVRIVAVNHGQRPASITGLSIELPDQRTMALVGAEGTQLPATLQQGESATAIIHYRRVGEALIDAGFTESTRVRPIAYDSLGNRLRGPKLKLEPQEMAQSTYGPPRSPETALWQGGSRVT